MMRSLCIGLFVLLHCGYCFAQKPWLQHAGAFVNLNTSQLVITSSTAASYVTGVQWSAGFGLYWKSPIRNMFRIEGQIAYEATGSGKTTYYERIDDEWIRIYDRYRTIPVSVLLMRSIGWKESWSIGLGGKSSFVLNYAVRHDSEHPGASGIIFSPDVRRWFGSGIVQLSHHFPYADVSLNGWYAFTPLIDQYAVKASPYGISFAVKVRLIPPRY